MEYLTGMCPLHGAKVMENDHEVCLVCSKPKVNIVSTSTRPATAQEIADYTLPGTAPKAPEVSRLNTPLKPHGGPEAVIEAIKSLTMPSDLRKCKTVLKLKQLAESLLEE